VLAKSEIRDRFTRLVRETGKFGVVGACSYVVDLTVFNVCLVGLGWQRFAALLASTVVSTTFAFVGNRFWTWRDRSRSGLHREYSLYFGFNLVGLVIGAICLWLSHDALGQLWPGAFHTALADNIAAKVVGVAFASAFRFWAYRRYVFRPQVSTSASSRSSTAPG
jgi:putative flippase GtrA